MQDKRDGERERETERQREKHRERLTANQESIFVIKCSARLEEIVFFDLLSMGQSTHK